MTTIKSSTKKGQNLINAYNRSAASELWEVYEKYSTDKSRANYLCRKRMESENGNGYKIISYNTFAFSVAWLTSDGLRVETVCNSYLVI